MDTCRCTTAGMQVTMSKIRNCGISCLSLEIGTVAVGKTVGVAVLVVSGDA